MIEANHYTTLQVSPNATAEEIKKAYRKLALQFHPDVAGDDRVDAEQFRNIKTAYDVLSNSKTRQQYHYKHFYTTVKTQPVVTAEWIAEQANDLAAFAKVLDPYRIDEEGLLNRILVVLSAYNLTVLKQANHTSLNKKIVSAVLYCTQLLPYTSLLQVNERLLSLSGSDVYLIDLIVSNTKLQRRLAYWNRYKLALALVITIGLCVAMYLLVK